MKNIRVLFVLFFLAIQGLSLCSMSRTYNPIARVYDLGCYKTICELLENPSQELFDKKKSYVIEGCKKIFSMIEMKFKSPKTKEEEKENLIEVKNKLQEVLKKLQDIHPDDFDIERLSLRFTRMQI